MGSFIFFMRVDQGYQGPKFETAVEKLTQATVEVVKRSSQAIARPSSTMGGGTNLCLASSESPFSG